VIAVASGAVVQVSGSGSTLIRNAGPGDVLLSSGRVMGQANGDAGFLLQAGSSVVVSGRMFAKGGSASSDVYVLPGGSGYSVGSGVD